MRICGETAAFALVAGLTANGKPISSVADMIPEMNNLRIIIPPCSAIDAFAYTW